MQIKIHSKAHLRYIVSVKSQLMEKGEWKKKLGERRKKERKEMMWHKINFQVDFNKF